MATNQDGISLLIVDDEKKACTNLKNLLLTYVDAGVNIVGVAHSTADAEQMIRQWQPDAVFLDIEMPNEHAFGFLERITPFDFEVVFVTAYDEYALRAFRLNAVDYILKPISIDELKNAVQKLKEKLRYKKLGISTLTPYAAIAVQIDQKERPRKITLRDANSMEIVDFRDIHFVEAQSSYSRIVFSKNGLVKDVVMSKPLSEYEELLPEDIFFRIHRAYLINCAQVETIISDDSASVVLKQGSVLPISRRRHTALIEFLKDGDFVHE